MNFSKTCRVCLTILENNYMSLYEQIEDTKILIATKIMEFAGVQVRNIC